MTYTYSESQFKNIDHKDYNLSFIKTDRNGTKYFEGVCKCWKCSGIRIFECWGHVDNGVCWACNGTGVNPCKVKVMTDEHYQKLENDRIAKQQKAIDERKSHTSEINAEFFKRNGFNENGKIWAIVKTGFVSKEFQKQMFEKGAKQHGWNIYLFSEPQEGAIELDAKDCCYADMYGVYNDFESSFMNQLIADTEEAERKAKAEKSSYFGNVGDKVDGLTAVALLLPGGRRQPLHGHKKFRLNQLLSKKSKKSPVHSGLTILFNSKIESRLHLELKYTVTNAFSCVRDRRLLQVLQQGHCREHVQEVP